MDLRKALNAVSDVVANRPKPLRRFDQIYMKSADMLIQAQHIAKWLAGKSVVFIGDGDALALTAMHLAKEEHLPEGPSRVHILDFDERVVNSVSRFAERHGYHDTVSASLYNVAEPIPLEHRGMFDAFYTNPPFGRSNSGVSVIAFLRRGIEATKEVSTCCAVLADDSRTPWCTAVLRESQRYLLDQGYWVSEVVPRMHSYHLEENPELTSCSIVASRVVSVTNSPPHIALSDSERANFYGRNQPLTVKYIRDHTNGEKLESRDYSCEPF